MAAAASATSAGARPTPNPGTAKANPSRCPYRLLERFSSSLHKSAARTGALPARAIVESVRPEVDCGRFPVKRALGDQVLVEADVFADGHDAVSCELLFRFQGEADWR